MVCLTVVICLLVLYFATLFCAEARLNDNSEGVTVETELETLRTEPPMDVIDNIDGDKMTISGENSLPSLKDNITIDTEIETSEIETEEVETEEIEVPETKVPEIEKPVVEEVVKPKNILFVGNSLVEGLKMVSEDDNDFICEVGISLKGLKSNYFDDIAKYPCDVVAIEMGTNELGSYSEVGFKNYYTALIKHIRSINPNSKIICLSIPPVSEYKSNNDELYNNENVSIYNSYIREVCDENNVVFFDNTGYFGAVLKKEWTSDGIHLYGSIYRDWYNYLIDKICKF